MYGSLVTSDIPEGSEVPFPHEGEQIKKYSSRQLAKVSSLGPCSRFVLSDMHTDRTWLDGPGKGVACFY